MNLLVDYARHVKLHKDKHLIRVEDQLLEELAELIAIIIRKRRKDRNVSLSNVASEIADVEICLAYFKKVSKLNKTYFDNVLEGKLLVLKGKLNG